MSAEKEKYPTLEEILEKYPLETVRFSPESRDDDIEANVARNEEGVILYVEPFSVHSVPREPITTEDSNSETPLPEDTQVDL